MNQRIWLSVVFLMSRMDVTDAADRCNTQEYSAYGMSLRGHTFKTVQAHFPGECCIRCKEAVKCQSYNVIAGPNVCELNNRTKEARPEDRLHAGSVSVLHEGSNKMRYFLGFEAQSLPSCCFLRQETLPHILSPPRCTKWVPATYCWG